MTTTIDTREVCCAALELSKSSWVFAFAAPDGQTTVHKIRARDVDRLIGILNSSKAKAEHRLGLPLQIVLCYEVGYDVPNTATVTRPVSPTHGRAFSRPPSHIRRRRHAHELDPGIERTSGYPGNRELSVISRLHA